MLDRWSIMVYETKFPRQHSTSTVTEDYSDTEVRQILTYEDSVAAHLTKILTSDQHSVCGVLKEKLDSLLKTLNEESQASSVLPVSPPPPPPPPPTTIAEEQEEEGVLLPPRLTRPHPPHPPCSPRCNSAPPAAIFKPREQLMLRANSLKKAIRQIIEHTERAVDEQNSQSQEMLSLGGAPEEEEEEEEEDDRVSLQSSHSSSVYTHCHSVSKTPCEKLITKGGLCLGSSASLPAQTGSREHMLNTKILFPSLRVGVSGSLSSSSVISRLLVNADPFSCHHDNM
ncbi:hypothetical protein CRUP_005489 [Coryphaenoides rupestris]|nr:hypothetical protein CRUP_005489 [Coryphaenoides rupestris]